jgi:hypothetical protein
MDLKHPIVVATEVDKKICKTTEELAEALENICKSTHITGSSNVKVHRTNDLLRCETPEIKIELYGNTLGVKAKRADIEFIRSLDKLERVTGAENEIGFVFSDGKSIGIPYMGEISYFE